jgi:membrane protein DedA with SNARE-associated domain
MAGWVMSWVVRFSYPAVYALLVACGLGFPFSEDVIVLTGGVVVAHGHGLLGLMILSAYAGKVTGDALIFRFGRKLGPHALTRPHFRKLFTPQRMAWIETHFKKYGVLTVFLARFLPGLRAATYLTAGASGFSPRKFLLADGFAAGISAPVLTYLGYRYGLAVLTWLRPFLHETVVLVLAVVALVAGVKLVRRSMKARSAAKQVPPAVLEELPRHLPHA